MCRDEIYKFCDGTLLDMRTALHDIDSNLKMTYLPRVQWTSSERKKARVMMREIDKVLFERRLMRSLEPFVGGRDFKKDVRLLERTI